MEVALLAGGGWGAHRFVRRVGHGARSVVLLVSVTAWFLLFGLVPFLAFALLVPSGRPHRPGAGPFETLVLNLVPFALVAGPVLGAVQARGRRR